MPFYTEKKDFDYTDYTRLYTKDFDYTDRNSAELIILRKLANSATKENMSASLNWRFC